MARLEAERIALAKSTNLVDWLKHNSNELRQVGRYEYELKSIDSLRINSEKNCWIRNSTGAKGNPVDFLIEFYGLDFRQAVQALTPQWQEQSIDQNVQKQVQVVQARRQQEQQELQNEKKWKSENETYLKSANNNRAKAYLNRTRGIDLKIIEDLIVKGKIMQVDTIDRNGEVHQGNIAFRITDENGVWKGAELNGTLSDPRYRYKQSTPETGYGFTLHIGKPQKLCVFESAIDLISFYQLHQNKLKDTALVSIAGVTKEKTLLDTTERYKNQYGVTGKNIFLCVDNDQAGNKFILKYQPQLNCTHYRADKAGKDFFGISSHCKDWNDLLIKVNEHERQQVRDTNVPNSSVQTQTQELNNCLQAHDDPHDNR